MIIEFQAMLRRASPTLLEDALGVAGLFTLLVAALYLPALA